MTDSTPVELVQKYIEASQQARQNQGVDDFEKLRAFLAADVTIKMASAWTDEPWRVVLQGADALLERLHAPINQGTSLTTVNVNVVPAGDDVLVEQLSTIRRDGRDHVSIVCHIFTINEGKISQIRAYRNDAGLPAG